MVEVRVEAPAFATGRGLAVRWCVMGAGLTQGGPWRLLAPIAEPIIGGFFIDYIAAQTLAHLKLHLEKK